MKTIWQVIAVLCVIHMLGALGLLGWLSATDRLNRDRAQTVTQLFQTTVAQEKQRKAQAEAMEKNAEEQAAKIELAKGSAGAAPGAVAERLALEHQRNEIGIRQLERTRNDIESLRRQLQLEQAKLQQDQQAMVAQKQALETRIKQLDGKLEDAGMKRVVSLYESLPAKQAKQMFSDLIGQQRLDDVVTYLGAMDSRKAAAILKEFKTPAELSRAVQITEQLRRHGKNPASMTSSPAPVIPRSPTSSVTPKLPEEHT